MMYSIKTEQPSDTLPAAENTLEASSVNVKSEDGNNDVRGPEHDAHENFPQKLMDVIEQETKNGAKIDGKNVMEWLESGTSFIVRDKKALEKEVLPKHFHAKCKYMSFVRKLYRWGFRQINKSSPQIMIFMHTNFIRGDKKRCLKMRSIVKSQQPQQAPPPAAHENNLQGYGPSSNNEEQQFNGIDPDFRSAAVAQYQVPQYDTSYNRHSPLNQGPQADFFPSNSDQYSQGPGGRMTSADMFEAGLRLQRIEQRQRELHMMSMYTHQGDGLFNRQGDSLYNQKGDGPFNCPSQQRNSNASSPSAPTFGYPPQAPVSPPSASISARLNSYSSTGKSNMGGGMSDVDLAAEIMKRNPGMEPREALELVSKRF